MDTLSHHRTTPSVARYGVQQVAWKDIIAVLELLGGVNKRNTNGHNEDLYEFPGGTIVKIPNGTRRQRDVHSWVFKRLLAQVEATGCELSIFLALLEQRRVAWYKRDPFVAHLAVVLKEGDFDVQDPEERKRALRVASEHFAPTPEEQAEAETAAEPVSYSLMEAIGAVVGDDDLKMTYYHRFKAQFYTQTGPLYRAVKDDLVEQENVRLPRLGEAAAFTVMEFTEAAEEERNPAPESESPEPLAAALIEEETHMDQTRRKTDLPAKKRTPETAPQALMALCEVHGIYPVFNEYVLDVDKTLLALAEAALK